METLQLLVFMRSFILSENDSSIFGALLTATCAI